MLTNQRLDAIQDNCYLQERFLWFLELSTSLLDLTSKSTRRSSRVPVARVGVGRLGRTTQVGVGRLGRLGFDFVRLHARLRAGVDMLVRLHVQLGIVVEKPRPTSERHSERLVRMLAMGCTQSMVSRSS